MQKFLSGAQALHNKICQIEIILAVACLSASVTAIFLSTICRVAGAPIRWGLDVALLLFAWSTFLGADIAFRTKSLVKVDILIGRVPPAARKVFEAVIYALMVSMMLFLIYQGTKLAIISHSRVFNGLPHLSYSWATASVPVSMFLMLINALKQIHETFFAESASSEEAAAC